jgi:hypothetical protein
LFFLALAVLAAIDCWLMPTPHSVWWEPLGLGAVALLNAAGCVAWYRSGN